MSVDTMVAHIHERTSPEYKVDYNKEPCPPPFFQFDQPGGSHLERALEQPKSTWHVDPDMSQATLHGHLQALAQSGSQHALFRSQQGMLRTRSEAIRIWDRSNEAFQQLAREPIPSLFSRTMRVLSWPHTMSSRGARIT